jgi:acetyl-CoA carboxylase biotin carboxyl carrier protein
VDLKDIKAIIDLMKKNSISEFELERQDFKIKLKRGGAQVVQYEDTTTAIALPMNNPATPLPATSDGRLRASARTARSVGHANP